MKVRDLEARLTAYRYDRCSNGSRKIQAVNSLQTLVTRLKLLAGRGLLWSTIAICGIALASGPAMSADSNIEAEADKVLKAMSAYFSNLQKVSVEADVDMEAIMRNGQKLQLTSLVNIALERPGKLHVRRQGAYADGEILFDGQTVTLHAISRNAYAQLKRPGTIDDALDTLGQETDLDAPAADLFRSDPYSKLTIEVTNGSYLGTTFVNGEECHHLAFRTDVADWQIWVRSGDAALPMKYIVTSKWTSGSPQYSVRFRNWDTSPVLAAGRFKFTPSEADRRLDTIPVNEVGEFSLEEEAQQ